MFSPRQPEKRSPVAIVVSAVLHVAVGLMLVRAVVGSNGIAEWLIGPAGKEQQEKIVMVPVRPPQQASSGGGAPVDPSVKPVAGSTSTTRLVAPTAVPTTVTAPASGKGGAGGGTGTGFGAGSGAGIARGVVPGYDPRLYPGPAAEPRVVRSPKERLDSVIAERFAQYADSVNSAPRNGVSEDGRADLVFTRNGKKYGMTQGSILLGPIKLPTALLALLPLNRVGGNPSSMLRGENPWQMRQQIRAGAQVALNAETFNERVKRIRERRDRERQDAREGTTTAPITQPQVVPVPAQQPDRP